MNLLGFLFVILFSISSHAMQCQDLFVKQVSEQSFETLPENFTQMNINERLETLDYMTIFLKGALSQNPQPGFLGRYLSRDGAQQNREHLRLRNLYAEAKKLKDNYHVVQSLLHGEVKRHELERGDEIQLLNRLMEDSEVLNALKFLNQRQLDLHGSDKLEQYFIDSVVMYLAWGPNPKLFPVAINHWLIFDIFLGHEDLKYMVVVSHRFRDGAKMYRSEKEGLTPNEAAIEDYRLLSQDPVLNMIEKTEQKSPHIIDRLIEQEIDKGHLVYDDATGALRIVDDSL